MKLATLNDGTRDGSLVIVRRDGKVYTPATDIAPTLQAALDDWSNTRPMLESRAADLESGVIDGQAVDTTKLHSPLPRAYEWIDGSAYINHIVLVRKARNAEPPETLETDPLIYQGGSGHLLAPTEDIPLVDEEWGLDFEAEVAVILDDTPRGTPEDELLDHVALIVLVNDITLRNLIPGELAKSFGFFQSKPASAFSPFAVTPDELGDAWQDGRIHLPLNTYYNGEKFGDPDAGPAMHFSFKDLIKHLTKTRSYTAGTILGSGTVSNDDRSRGSSCLAEKRMLEKIDTGEFHTPFMKAGDTVKIEMLDANGNNIFGTIDQKVVEA
jgi:fumarylacetoacetate (FAA) hydrolase